MPTLTSPASALATVTRTALAPLKPNGTVNALGLALVAAHAHVATRPLGGARAAGTRLAIVAFVRARRSPASIPELGRE